MEPIEGENVSLVGESYNPQRSTWSDGAYKSSINLLNNKFGFAIDSNPPLLKAIAPLATARQAAAVAAQAQRTTHAFR